MSELKSEMTNKIMLEFSKTIEMFDLSPVEARLFAFLYLEGEPLTLDEMSEALGKSKTSMSNSIRNLADFNLVTRVWKKGVRKDLYQANKQLFKIFMNSYINKWIEATNYQKTSLEEINQSFSKQYKDEALDGDFAAIDYYLKNIIEFHNQLEIIFKDMKQDD